MGYTFAKLSLPGRFREDLLYRLNVFTIKLPLLQERIGDIPILAKHFLEKYNKKAKKSIKGIGRGTLQCLEAYHFPGNVRESWKTRWKGQWPWQSVEDA